MLRSEPPGGPTFASCADVLDGDGSLSPSGPPRCHGNLIVGPGADRIDPLAADRINHPGATGVDPDGAACVKGHLAGELQGETQETGSLPSGRSSTPWDNVCLALRFQLPINFESQVTFRTMAYKDYK